MHTHTYMHTYVYIYMCVYMHTYWDNEEHLVLVLRERGASVERSWRERVSVACALFCIAFGSSLAAYIEFSSHFCMKTVSFRFCCFFFCVCFVLFSFSVAEPKKKRIKKKNASKKKKKFIYIYTYKKQKECLKQQQQIVAITK